MIALGEKNLDSVLKSFIKIPLIQGSKNDIGDLGARSKMQNGKEKAISKWKIASVQDDFEYMANGSGKVVRWQGGKKGPARKSELGLGHSTYLLSLYQ